MFWLDRTRGANKASTAAANTLILTTYGSCWALVSIVNSGHVNGKWYPLRGNKNAPTTKRKRDNYPYCESNGQSIIILKPDNMSLNYIALLGLYCVPCEHSGQSIILFKPNNMSLNDIAMLCKKNCNLQNLNSRSRDVRDMERFR